MIIVERKIVLSFMIYIVFGIEKWILSKEIHRIIAHNTWLHENRECFNKEPVSAASEDVYISVPLDGGKAC